jgi:hypothetical protein
MAAESINVFDHVTTNGNGITFTYGGASATISNSRIELNTDDGSQSFDMSNEVTYSFSAGILEVRNTADGPSAWIKMGYGSFSAQNTAAGTKYSIKIGDPKKNIAASGDITLSTGTDSEGKPVLNYEWNINLTTPFFETELWSGSGEITFDDVVDGLAWLNPDGLGVAIKKMQEHYQRLENTHAQVRIELINAGVIKGNINTEANSLWDSAQNWIQRGDPIVLDLDGDGLETTSVNGSTSIQFDHNADGVKTATGWVAPDDGLLVMDRNGNGVIDNGRELFGDQTLLADETRAADGFMALTDIDSNEDGIIDANDTQFADLRIWRDLNQDGLSQENELFTLADLEIASLSTASEAVNQNLNGNVLSSTGSYTKSDGTEGVTGSLFFGSANFYSTFTEAVEIPEALQSLPNMSGSGQVRDLKEAAALSSEVASLLQDYSAATTRADQEAILDDLIHAWGETSGMDPMTERALQNGFFVQYRFGNMRPTSFAAFAKKLPIRSCH